MGIFSRFRDIVSSNINAMLDKAEDPEKMIKMMIREMEDTLVELKASCAATMATRTKVERALRDARQRAAAWEGKAELAIEKGREDLAREAVSEKRRLSNEADDLETEAEDLTRIVTQSQSDIHQLEEKLEAARKKHRVLVERHVHARQRKEARGSARRSETTDAFHRFEQFETRIDRMEAEAELEPIRRASAEDAFSALERDEGVERELEEIKARVSARTAS